MSGFDDPPSLLKKPLVQGTILFALTLLVYIPGFSADYIWDDDITLTNNPMVKLPLGEGLRYIWFSTHPTDYYPMTWSSFWLEWRIWGTSPAGYHAVNILLHALSAVFIWRILTILRIPGAWAAALLFAVHPVCVDSVVWISQRKNTLSMFFYALTVLGYLKYDESGSKTLYWLSVLAFAAGLLSKTSIIAAPLIILLLLWFKDGRVTRFHLQRILPFFALAFLGALMTLWFQGKVLGYSAETGHAAADTILEHLESSSSGKVGLFQRILIAGHVYWFYFLKMIVPVGISMVYPRWNITADDALRYLPTLLLVVALVTTFLYRKKIGRGPFTGFAYLFAAVFPVLGLFSMSYHNYAWVANHLCYVAVPGVVAAVVGCAAWIFRKSGEFLPRALPAALCALIALTFASQSWSRAGLYRDPVDLWRDTIAKSPESAAGYNELGIIYTHRKNYPPAKEAFEKAIELAPRFPKPRNNLGTVLSYMGNDEEAIPEFEKAIEINPLDADAMGNLGLMYVRVGKPEKAIAYFKKTLELRLMSPATYHNMGIAYQRIGKPQEAYDAFRRAIEMNPSHAMFHVALADLCYNHKRFAEALEQHLIALDLDPGIFTSYNAAAWIMATNQDPALRNGRRALEFVRQAEQLATQKIPALVITKAAALAELGRYDEAVAVLEEMVASATEPEQEALVKRARNDIRVYQSRQPYREGGTPSPKPSAAPAPAPAPSSP